ncbi:MAG: hypothetical protein K2N72_04455, partial [Oscillospiraceae bacterium]|nr:hypothetical protein [Oscillospiraceae bacterium]
MPDQGEYFGGNGGYQRQPVNGGYNGSNNNYGSGGNFPANNQPQAAQTAQAAYSRGAGAFPYSRQNRPNGFVNGSSAYGNGGYGSSMNGNAVNGNAVNRNIMNGNPAGQPVPNMNFPTNSGIRQFQQGGQGQNNNYRNNFGNRNS